MARAPKGKTEDTPSSAYQGFAVKDYGCILSALDLGHPRLLQRQDRQEHSCRLREAVEKNPLNLGGK